MIILTARNNLELTKACYRTLTAQLARPGVLIVDNASSDGTARWARVVARVFPEAEARQPVMRRTYMRQASVARLWNEALDFAWSRAQQLALVVNNDTELLPETYELLRMFLVARPAIGMATCVSVRERERLVLPVDVTEPPSPHPDYSCFMITRWAHHLVRFDERCEGAFYEDNVHHVELHRAGIRAVNIGVPFLHHGSMTIKTADVEEKRAIEAHAARNKEYFFSRFGCYPGTEGYRRLFEQGVKINP